MRCLGGVGLGVGGVRLRVCSFPVQFQHLTENVNYVIM